MAYEEPGVKVIQELQLAAANVQSADQVLTLVGELYEVFEDEVVTGTYDALTGGGEQDFAWPGKKTTSVVDLAGVRKSTKEVDSQLPADYPLKWKLRDPETGVESDIDELTDIYAIDQTGFTVVEGSAAAVAKATGSAATAAQNREFHVSAAGLISAGVTTGDRVVINGVKGTVTVSHDDHVFFTPDSQDFTVKTAVSASSTPTSLVVQGGDVTVPASSGWLWIGSGATLERVQYTDLTDDTFTVSALVFDHVADEEVKVEIMDAVDYSADDVDLTSAGYITSDSDSLTGRAGQRVAIWVEQNAVVDGAVATGVVQSSSLGQSYANVGQKIGVWSSDAGDGGIDTGSGVVAAPVPPATEQTFTVDAGTPFVDAHVGSYIKLTNAALEEVYVRITGVNSTTQVTISSGSDNEAKTGSQLYGLVVRNILAVDADNNNDITISGTAIADGSGLPIVLYRPVYRDLVEDDLNTDTVIRYSGADIPSDTGWRYQVPVDFFDDNLVYEIFPAYELLVSYRALDVSSVNDMMTVYTASDLSSLATVSKDNPLLWAAQAALVAMGTEDTPIHLMPVDLYAGLDEATGYPTDKVELQGYLEALEIMNRSESVYFCVPLTRNSSVRDAFASHVTANSDPCEKNERICALTYAMPLGEFESTSGIIAPGLDGGNSKIVDAGNNFLSQQQLLPGNTVVIVSPAAYAGEYALDVGSTEDELVLETDNWEQVSEMTVTDGEFSIGGSGEKLLTSATEDAFKDAEEGDYLLNDGVTRKIIDVSANFRTLTYEGVTLTGTAQTVSILRSSVGVEYYTKPLDKTEQAEALKAISQSRGNRRVIHMWPDNVEMVTGTDSSGNEIKEMMPSYYAAAAEMGRLSVIPIQRSSTGMALGGFTALEHSNFYFNKSQINDIAEGGWAILEQKVQGGSVLMRHLLTTDTSSTKTQEVAFTKNVDNMAKVKRASVEPLLNDENGRINITKKFIGFLTPVFQSIFEEFVKNEQLVRTEDAEPYTIISITQDTTKPDRILERVKLNVPLPANNVDVTFVI